MKSALVLLALSLALPALAATEKKIDRASPAQARPLAVTLDVKDEDARDILKSMQRQCAIKNLIIDPQVQGKGTFFLHDVPCGSAFDVVFRTFGLKSVIYSNSVVTAEPRR